MSYMPVRDCEVCSVDVCLTRVSRAMTEMSTGMYVGVRDCHIYASS